ncbi:MAG: hypothetical protein ACE5JT_02310 [Nitrosopumilaceae archaeon]
MAKKKSKKIRSTHKIKREPNATLLKKIGSVSDTTKLLSKEVKGMTKIFAENQKVLISLKKMIDNVNSALSYIQKQSRQIRVIEEDTQKLFVGLRQANVQSNLVSKIKDQVNRIQQRQESLPDTGKIMQSVTNSLDSIKNNAKMIMRVSDRIDGVQNGVRNVGSELDSLAKKVGSLPMTGNDVRNIQAEFANFKENVIGKTTALNEKISDLTELLNRNTASMTEFKSETHEINQGLQEIRNVTQKTSENTSREVLGLLRLSEYQSNIRMHSESKYGELGDLEKMASQTAEMVNLFDKLSIESEAKIPLPQEVKQWAVSKVLDSADKWEIRFTDVFNLLVNELGRDLLKESIRIQQVRDLFGIRAVDEVKQELSIS